MSSSSKYGWTRLKKFVCPMQYYYEEVLSLEQPKSYAAVLGIAYHAALAEYARRIGEASPYDVVMEAAAKSWQEEVVDAPYLAVSSEKFQADISRCLQAYIDAFRLPEPFTYELIEREHEIDLTHIRDAGVEGMAPRLFSGRIDAVVRLSGDLYVLEHKTTNQSVDKFMAQYAADKQPVGYTVLAEDLLTEQVKGVILRVCHKGGYAKTAEARCYQDVFPITPAQKTEWRRQIQCMYAAIEHCKETGEWYCMETACHQYATKEDGYRCPYRALCEQPDQDPTALWLAQGGTIRKEEKKDGTGA